MKSSDAAKILELSGEITPELVKAAYKRAALKYHPDRNPAGEEMMKMINAAEEILKDSSGNLTEEESCIEDGYPEAVFNALQKIISLPGLDIEICGSWVWVDGATFPHKAELKEAGFKFAPKKKRWYFRPEDWKSRSRGALAMDEIREKYGSSRPDRPHQPAIQH